MTFRILFLRQKNFFKLGKRFDMLKHRTGLMQLSLKCLSCDHRIPVNRKASNVAMDTASAQVGPR